jgi:hypothetical protein
MVTLSIDDLKKIKDIVAELGIDQFTLKQEGTSGIGSTLTLSCGTFVKDYPATITVEINGVEAW